MSGELPGPGEVLLSSGVDEEISALLARLKGADPSFKFGKRLGDPDEKRWVLLRLGQAVRCEVVHRRDETSGRHQIRLNIVVQLARHHSTPSSGRSASVSAPAAGSPRQETPAAGGLSTVESEEA